jgi:AraC-like DNA-binding protein
MIYSNLRVQDFLEFDPYVTRPISIGYEQVTSAEYKWDNERQGPLFEHCIFQYTLSGHGYFEANGKTVKLEKNVAFLASAESPFLYYFRPDVPHWEFFWLNFIGDSAKTIFHSIKKEFGPVVKFPDNTTAVHRFFELFDKTRYKKWKSVYDLSAVAYAFLMNLKKELRAGNPAPDKNIITQAAQYMELHLADNIDVKVVAPRFGYTREHFTRLFRQATGTSPGNYLVNLRLEKAKQLLRLMDEKLESVAGSCGFANANYLCRVFKRRFGLTPVDYKKTFDATIK